MISVVLSFYILDMKQMYNMLRSNVCGLKEENKANYLVFQ